MKSYAALFEPVVVWYIVEINLLTKIKLFCCNVFVVIPYNWSIINFRNNVLKVHFDIFDLQLLYLTAITSICIFLFSQEDSLWACLAAMAAYAKELATAEVAYAAIDEVYFPTT